MCTNQQDTTSIIEAQDEIFLNDPTLVDPDAEPEVLECEKFNPSDPKLQLGILAGIVYDETLLKQAREQVKPIAFTEKTSQRICKVAYDLYDALGQKATKAELESELKERYKGRTQRSMGAAGTEIPLRSVVSQPRQVSCGELTQAGKRKRGYHNRSRESIDPHSGSSAPFSIFGRKLRIGRFFIVISMFESQKGVLHAEHAFQTNVCDREI